MLLNCNIFIISYLKSRHIRRQNYYWFQKFIQHTWKSKHNLLKDCSIYRCNKITGHYKNKNHFTSFLIQLSQNHIQYFNGEILARRLSMDKGIILDPQIATKPLTRRKQRIAITLPHQTLFLFFCFYTMAENKYISQILETKIQIKYLSLLTSKYKTPLGAKNNLSKFQTS